MVVPVEVVFLAGAFLAVPVLVRAAGSAAVDLAVPVAARAVLTAASRVRAGRLRAPDEL